MSRTKTPTIAETLHRESDPALKPEPVTFKIKDRDGRDETVLVPVPLPVTVWLWVLEKSLDYVDGADGTAAISGLMTGIALVAPEILSRATGVPLARLREQLGEGIEDVCDQLADQLRGELHNAAPFSEVNARAAARAFQRKLRLLRLPNSDGGQAQSELSLSAVAETGANSAE